MLSNVSRPSVVDVLQPFAVGDTFYADTTTSLAKLADVAVGNALLSGGVGAAPAWGKVAMSTAISGILPAVNGGTGVANTGTITNASNTTITGGGTLALGGFTATVPATGTVDLLGTAQTISALKTLTGGLTLTTTDAILTDINVVISSVTGTKFGTSTAQKLSFYNSAPVAQQTGDVLTALATGKLGLIASPTISATTLTGIVPSTSGGTGVNNAGTLTNASNTTITGGGTLALAGFTLTVPATGTAGLLATANTWTLVNNFSNTTNSTTPATGSVISAGTIVSARVVAEPPFAGYITTADTFSEGLRLLKRGTTGDSTAAVASGGELGYHSFYGWSGAGYSRGAYVRVITRETFTATNNGTDYTIYAANTASATPLGVLQVWGDRVSALVGRMTIRTDNGGSGAQWLQYTESGTADRWSVGCKVSNASMYWNNGLFGAGTDCMNLSSAGVLTLPITTGVNLVVSSTDVASITTAGGIKTGSTTLHTTSVALTNGAAASLGTLTNAPAAGNPTKWVPINDNGVTRYCPLW